MNSKGRKITTGASVAVSMLLAVGFPAIAHWRLRRPAALYEM